MPSAPSQRAFAPILDAYKWHKETRKQIVEDVVDDCPSEAEDTLVAPKSLPSQLVLQFVLLRKRMSKKINK